MADPKPTPKPLQDPEHPRDEEQNADRDGRERMPTEQKDEPVKQQSE